MRKLGQSAICIAVVIGLTQQATAGLITFDDFSNAAVNDQITNGYQGYNWNNVFIANKNAFPGTGFAAGTVSGNYTGLSLIHI